MRILVFGLYAPEVADSPGRVARLVDALGQEGHVVESFDEPLSARWLCEQGDFDLVVVCAPRVGGTVLDWCARLRSGAVWVPALVVVETVTPAEVIACLDAGADDCVAPPLTLGEITARARALGRRQPTALPSVLEVGDLRLDPGARRAWRGEVELELSPREFVLLQTFMEHPGQTLTRARLLDLAWASSSDPSSNVVDQAIKHLRRRVDQPFGRHDLQTVRGMGYRLEVDA